MNDKRPVIDRFTSFLGFIGAIISGLFLLLWIGMSNEFGDLDDFAGRDIIPIIFLVSIPVIFTVFGIEAKRGKKWTRVLLPVPLFGLLSFIFFAI